MDKQETGYDYIRYKQLLAEAVDETKRLELIEIMIRENARDRLEAQRAADRVAMTAMTVARVLGPGGVAITLRAVIFPKRASPASHGRQRAGEKAILQDRQRRLELRPPLPSRRAARLT